MSISDEKIKEAYGFYKEFCRQNGFEAASFAVFRLKLDIMASKVLAHKIANNVPDASQAHYIATLVEEVREPFTDAVMRTCMQCDRSCWIQRDMVDKADASKGIICNQCVPELTGKSMDDLVAEQISRL